MRADLFARLILPPPGARVLCAVSGGADSMCLLALLGETGDYTLAAAHFEHGIRGAESLRDCAFVEDRCRETGVACFVGHAEVPRIARERGAGLEETARELRYAFLERTADEQGFEALRAKRQPGRPRKLTGEQLEEVRGVVADGSWDGPSLSEHVLSAYGVELSARQCQRIIQGLGA